MTARFYMVIVLAVLLIGRTYIRPKKSAPTEWVYPSVPTSLAAAHLLPLRMYLDRRRVKFREYETSTSDAQPPAPLHNHSQPYGISSQTPPLTRGTRS